PEERLAFMLQDAGAPVLVTQARLVETLAPHTLLSLCLDRDWNALADQSKSNPIHLISDQSLAYVIYTSGSTGSPKGVAITHDGLRNLLVAMQKQLPLSPDDRFLAITTIGFDIAALELFLPLVSGAHLSIAVREVVQDPGKLAETIKETGITILQATPTIWHALAANLVGK